MKNVMTAAAALAGMLSFGAGAFAQGYPVGDGMTEAATQATARSTLATATSAAAIDKTTGLIEDDTKQIQTNTSNTATNTLNTYKMFTATHDVTAIFKDDDSDTVKNVMPDTGVSDASSSDSIVKQVSFAKPMLTTAGNTLYGQNNVPTTALSSDADPVLLAQDAAQKVSANIQGMAVANLNALKLRLSQLSEMNTALSSATSITQVETINGAIAAETVAVQAEQAQAENLVALATAQAEINRENEAQAMRLEHKQTASLFTAAV
ncbi:MAG: type IV secretion system protein, partial [Janthinobacterium lividum]